MTTDAERITHMLDAIQKSRSIVGDTARDDFMASAVMQDAVFHNFAVLEEAAGRLSQGLRQKNRDIPRGNIIGMRNVLSTIT